MNLVGTRSYGIEGTLDLKLMDNLHFNGNITLQNAKYTTFQQNGTTSVFVGNELERQADMLYNAGLYYDDGALDISVFTNYTGDNYTAANNAIYSTSSTSMPATRSRWAAAAGARSGSA